MKVKGVFRYEEPNQGFAGGSRPDSAAGCGCHRHYPAEIQLYRKWNPAADG